MFLHQCCVYGLVEVNFSGTEFTRICVAVPTVCSMWIDTELLRLIFCNRRADLRHLEHLISISNTYKITEGFDCDFRVHEKLFKVDRNNSVMLRKLIRCVNSSSPYMADGYGMIVHPITKHFFHRQITSTEESAFPLSFLR